MRRYPELAELYKIREAFYALCENSEDVEDAKSRYNTWLSLIPKDPAYRPIRSFCKTISRWETEFFNYFVEPRGERISNGAVEAAIGSIKGISCSGYGYKFETLRGKLLFGESSICKQTGGKRPPSRYYTRRKKYVIEPVNPCRTVDTMHRFRNPRREGFGRKRKHKQE